MPKLASGNKEDQEGSQKRVRVEDPADSGSQAKPFGSPKYSNIPSMYSKFLMEKINKCANLELVEASYAKASWAKHCSAMNNLKKFEVESVSVSEWPLSLERICKYVSWALTSCNLKHSTVRSYLSSIKIVHELNNKKYNGDNAIVNCMLRGAENLNLYKPDVKGTRKVMTLSLLKIIGHQIAKCDWSEDSKLTVWGACTTAFFGALRIGEILAKNSLEFCEEETLLWKDLKFRKDGSILIHVKIDKSKNHNGAFVDLFEYNVKGCCPVKTLITMKNKKFNMLNPVFQFANGKNLCGAHLNGILFNLLFPVIGNRACNITGHSFRAGLPAAMANNPDLTNDREIKAWGRWSSDSYLVYTRLKLIQKRKLFNKIVSVLEL